MLKKALITGVTGQDGSHLAEFLIEKGYDVHGIVRRSSSFNIGRINHLCRSAENDIGSLTLHYGDITDFANISGIVNKVEPDEIYNLAAQSNVGISFETPEYTADTDGIGVLRILEAMRCMKRTSEIKLYHASTSELFGKVRETPQSETTPFYPVSPYACAKLYAYWTVRNYRETYGLFAVNGIMFNHEGERRGEQFVTRKITLAACRIACGIQKKLCLGNLDALRDWGYAKDYVECMWLMLQAEKPDDYVIATGENHTVREFCQLAFHKAGIEIEWSGSGPAEKGIEKATGRVVVEVDPKFFRPAEVSSLLGDPTKAKEELGWNPLKTPFDKLVGLMVDSDMRLAKAEAHSIKRQV